MARQHVILETHPSALGARGEGLAEDRRHRRVFVMGAIPGERVVARVVGERPTYLRARVEEILEPSPFRTEPPCPELARGCGGCQWQHVSVEGQRALKAAAIEDALRSPAIPHPRVRPTIALADTGYRTMLRAVVAGGRAGYRRARQHSLVPVSSCMVIHPLLED